MISFPDFLKLRKILSIGLIGVFLVSSSLFADPPAQEMGRRFGYCEEITSRLDPTHLPRTPRDPWYESWKSERTAVNRGAEQFDDLLVPRVYQRAEPSKLIPTLVRLHEKQPTSAKITRKLALTCLEAGQPKEARYWFLKTYQLDRKDLQALWNLAALSYRLGDQENTAIYLKEYGRVDPNTAWGKLAREFHGKGLFSGVSSNDAFSNEPARGGFITAGSGQTPGSILLIDGHPTTPEDVTSAEPPIGLYPQSKQITKTASRDGETKRSPQFINNAQIPTEKEPSSSSDGNSSTAQKQAETESSPVKVTAEKLP